MLRILEHITTNIKKDSRNNSANLMLPIKKLKYPKFGKTLGRQVIDIIETIRRLSFGIILKLLSLGDF